MNTWSIIITREIIRARAMSCSFLRSTTTQRVKARFRVANGLGASSNTMSVKPHEFFDHTGLTRPISRRRKPYSMRSEDNPDPEVGAGCQWCADPRAMADEGG